MTATLNDVDGKTQKVILAQITRSQFVIDYWRGVLVDTKDKPYFQDPKIRRSTLSCIKLCERYDAAISHNFTTGMGMEILRDAAYEFRKNIKQQLFFYEQAIKRILDMYNYTDSQFLTKMAVSKDLLDISSCITQCECMLWPPARVIARSHELPKGYGFMELPKEFCPNHPRPSTNLGYLVRQAVAHNKTVRQHLGLEDIKYDMEGGNSEILRSVKISSANICDAMQNYDVIYCLYADEGKTWDEARILAAEMMKDEETPKE